jgi:hypothetical protein
LASTRRRSGALSRLATGRSQCEPGAFVLQRSIPQMWLTKDVVKAKLCTAQRILRRRKATG